MSDSTRSSRADVATFASIALLAAALGAFVPSAAGQVQAPPLPSAVVSLAPSLRLQGGGEMRFFGFAIYDGWYWSPVRAFSLDQPLALDLHYRRSLKGRSIAERSVEEISKLGEGSAEQRTRWGEAMQRIFPDVADGDRLTGISLPPGVTRFFLNGRPIGEIDDRDFARAFFGIWLDPRTSRPDFRVTLLGEPR
jgi:hypothetical protein